MESFSIEEPGSTAPAPQEPPKRQSNCECDYVKVGIIVVLSCVVLQTTLQFFAVERGIHAADVFHSLLAEKPVQKFPWGTGLKGSTGEGGEEATCESGYYKFLGESKSFESAWKDFKVVESSFAKLLVKKSSDGALKENAELVARNSLEAYFEFPIDAITENDPMELGFASVFMDGPMAHFEQADYEDNVLKVFLESESDQVRVQLWDLSQRSEDADYGPLVRAADTAAKELWLNFKAVRFEKKAGNCVSTSVVVDISELLQEGFFAYGDDDDPGESVGPATVRGVRNIDAKTAVGHPASLDFTVTYEDVSFLNFRPKVSHETSYVRICVYALGKQTMPMRVADDRVGYFTTEFQLVGDYRKQKWSGYREPELIHPQVRLINRQRIREPAGADKDGTPIAKKGCEYCKRGFHYYIDPTIPKPFREATKKGIETWRKAFKEILKEDEHRIGDWKDVGEDIVYAHMPGDESWPADYDVADIRFNVISWVRGFGGAFGIGPSIVDPRTGEILKAVIVLTIDWLEVWLGEALFYQALPEGDGDEETASFRREVAAAAQSRRLGRDPLSLDKGAKSSGKRSPKLQKEAPRPKVSERTKLKESILEARRSCLKDGKSVRHQGPSDGLRCRAQLDHGPFILGLKTEDLSSEAAKALLEEGIADVTTHEVGHTFGLRHNFRGSLGVTMEQLQDEDWLKENGFTTSVMDYVPSNLIPTKDLKEGKPPPLLMNTVGSYDIWAIRYGYTPVQNEGADLGGASKYSLDPELSKIAEEYASATFTFASDWDTDDVDPYTRAFDLTDDPLAWHEQQLDLMQEALQTLEKRAVKGGEPWTNYGRAALRMLRFVLMKAADITSFIGGLKISRKHMPKAEDEGEQPVKPDLDTHQKAVDKIMYLLKAPLDGTFFPKPSAASKALVRNAEDYFGVEPIDLTRMSVLVKQIIILILLDEQKLSQLRWSDDLLDDRDERGRQSGLVIQLLQKCSLELLGVKGDAPAKGSADEWTEWIDGALPDVEASLEDVHLDGVKIAYLEALHDLTTADTDLNVRVAAVSEEDRLLRLYKRAQNTGGLDHGFARAADKVLEKKDKPSLTLG